jgi:hypothetical protein
MITEIIFNLSNFLALIGWLVLMLFPASRFVRVTIISGGLILLFAICYLGLIIAHFPMAEGDFSSLAGLMQFYENTEMVVAGWLHYLAFDLFAGVWITLNARSFNFRHWWIIPSLFLTFMFGPIGLLSYFILRAVITGNWRNGLFAASEEKGNS